MDFRRKNRLLQRTTCAIRFNPRIATLVLRPSENDIVRTIRNLHKCCKLETESATRAHVTRNLDR